MSEDRPVFRWSFSAWEQYETCPQAYKFKRIDRLPTQPPGPAAARGLDLHDRVERSIKNEIDVSDLLTADPSKRFGDKKQAVIHDKYIPIIEAYRDHPNGDRHTERKMCFDEEWYLTGPGKFASCVAVLDAVKFHITDEGKKVCEIGEWKSGSPKDRHADQRNLYAMFGLKGWLADEVRVTTYYLELDIKPERLVVAATAWDKLVAKWSARRDAIKRDKLFAPRTGAHCNWCDFSKRKGGPCRVG